MWNSLVLFDHRCLLAINGCHAPWADSFFWAISYPYTWVPLYLLLIGLIIWRWRKPLVAHLPACVWIILTFLLVVGLSDYISSGVIKHLVCRLRPTHNPSLAPMVHVLHGYTGGLYGFVSSHAANTMSIALLFSLLWHKKSATLLLMLWVALVCYSRVYLGVHYPADIVGGLIVGAVLALIAYFVLARWMLRPSAQVPAQDDDPVAPYVR